MSAGWVAGSVRARALARRRLGCEATRRLAAQASLADALRTLSHTPYARADMPGQTLAAAQHAIAATVLWDLRVLAGWLPRDGVRLLRTLAGWFELANVDELLQTMAGRPPDGEFQLGALATAWPQLRQAASLAGLRTALAASAWRDPVGFENCATGLDLGFYAARSYSLMRPPRTGRRLIRSWEISDRVAECGDPARAWAAGAAALLLVGERFAADRSVDPVIMHGALGLLGPAAAGAATFEELAHVLPARARWVLAGVSSPAGLWRAEAAWWTRVERDGSRLLGTSTPGSETVVGAVAVMTADAWRVCAALEIAARGGGPLEDYDAVA